LRLPSGVLTLDHRASVTQSGKAGRMAKQLVRPEPWPALLRAERKANIRLRIRVTNLLIALSILTNLATIAAVFLDGAGVVDFDVKVLLVLVAETVAHTATLFFTVIRGLFS
jgi:hypothetical protein